jgi:DNA replication regulator SLD2
MEENERQKYEVQAQDLRVALKQFEGDWARKNDGKKPSREAIKANPIIGRKPPLHSLRFATALLG